MLAVPARVHEVTNAEFAAPAIHGLLHCCEVTLLLLLLLLLCRLAVAHGSA
jgi:hypothetical protein